MRDPRYAQITVLTALAGWGLWVLDFEVRGALAVAVVGTALAVQWLGNRARGESFDPRSALISGLSLVLLLRTDSLWIGAAAAGLAIASKFLVRVRGKHVFNPTNGALVVTLLVSESAWVSSGQWGSGPIAAAAFVSAAGWVLRSARGDVAVAFLASWCALLVGRALWLGDPLAIPLHQLTSGALLLFAGFMISDPRTLPDARAGRIAFAIAVAVLGYLGRFQFHEPNALLFALAACAPAVPLIDRFLPGLRFTWHPAPKEASHATPEPEIRPAPRGLRPVGVAFR